MPTSADYDKQPDGTYKLKISPLSKNKDTPKVALETPKKVKKGPTQTERIVELVSDQNIYLFKDQYGEGYARIRISGHYEIRRLDSRDFRDYLNHLYKDSGETAQPEAIRNAILVLSAEAKFGKNSQTYHLHNRVALLNGAIYYDLSDGDWRVVKITTAGWEVLDDPPILFRRYKHQDPQVEPMQSEIDLRILFEVVRVPAEQQVLVLVWLISCMIPDIHHAILIANGPEGSAKSWLCYVLNSIVDPSKLRHLSLPSQQRELVQILDHTWVAIFDNVGYLSDWQMDCLCRAVTGDGFTKRELYSDDDDFLYTFKRCVGINAINLVISRPDFLDRAVIISLESIPDNERRSEQELEAKFNSVKSQLLGRCFDMLSKAMTIRPNVDLKKKPRMADFAEWGYAIAEVLGYGGKEFINAYSVNIQNRHKEVLAGTTIGVVLINFMTDRASWTGTATELLKLLADTAENMGVNTNSRDFPKVARTLSVQLNELRVTLANNGIIIERLKDVGPEKQRGWKITKQPTLLAIPTEEGNTDKEGEIELPEEF